MANRVHAGPLLKEWRTRRRLSQLDLSVRTGVSTRHLSCVETGRARPSRELLLHLADELEVPRRDTNELLLAAGFAPVYGEHDLDDAAMSVVRDVIRLVLDGNDTRPTTVIDSRWDLVDANAAALWLTEGVAGHLLEPPINVARLSLHPDGLARRIENLDEFAPHLLRSMRRTLAATHDPTLASVVDECTGLLPEPSRGLAEPNDDVILPMRLRHAGRTLSFLSTVTTFGTARDVTLSELSIETLHPADEATAAVLTTRPWCEPTPAS